MVYLILRAEEVQKVLNVCRSDSYQIIKDIRESYPYSMKLKGSKIRTKDLADYYDLSVEDIQQALIK